MSDDRALSIPSRAAQYAEKVLPKARLDVLAESLPDHIKPERFKRNLTIALTQQPKLLACDPSEVLGEVSKAAALGLYMDPQLGEAYLIVGYNGKERREMPQLRLGYRGLMKLGRQSGEIAGLYAHEVRANDMLSIRLGSDKELIHEPNYLASEEERGEIVLYYAVVKYRDGTNDFEPMSIADIYKIRDRSDGWKAFKDGKIKSTPWSTDESEMAKKTVLRRLMKRLPQSPEIADALAIEDQDFREEVVVERPSLRARLPGPSSTSAGFSTSNIEKALSEPETDVNDDLDDTLGGDEIPTFDPEPTADINTDEPGEWNDANEHVFQTNQEPKWDHLAWIEGTKDQASTFKDRLSLRQWWGIVLKGEDYGILKTHFPELAQRLMADVTDLAGKMT